MPRLPAAAMRSAFDAVAAASQPVAPHVPAHNVPPNSVPQDCPACLWSASGHACPSSGHGPEPQHSPQPRHATESQGHQAVHSAKAVRGAARGTHRPAHAVVSEPGGEKARAVEHHQGERVARLENAVDGPSRSQVVIQMPSATLPQGGNGLSPDAAESLRNLVDKLADVSATLKQAAEDRGLSVNDDFTDTKASAMPQGMVDLACAHSVSRGSGRVCNRSWSSFFPSVEVA